MALRIAYLLKKFPRLSETFVLNEMLRQEELGARVHVFSRREPDDEPRHPQIAELKAEVEVLPSTSGIAPWISLFDFSAQSPELMGRFAALVHALAEFDHPHMHSLFAEALYLLRRTAELDIQHVHVHFATEAAITAMILHELGGPPYSVTAHAKDIYRSTVDVRLLARIVERSRFTVTVCDANVEFLADRLPPAALRKIRRLYNGIDLERFSAPSAPREEDLILSVGRLVPKKGFDVLLEALALLRERGRSFRAALIGEGEERERLAGMVRGLGLESHVVLTGGVDQDVVREWMNRATVFCLPCIIGEDGNRDALPTVLLESLAVGLPSISTPVTGVPEILARGRAGVLVPERDPRATADALEQLLDSGQRRLEIAAAGRQHAERNFDARRAARTLAGWFEEAWAAARCA